MSNAKTADPLAQQEAFAAFQGQKRAADNKHQNAAVKKLLAKLGLGLIASLAACNGAAAAPVNFTWAPNAIGLPGSSEFTANNVGVNDYSNIAINTSTGKFSEDAVLAVSGFLGSSGAESVPGLNQPGGYNFYAVVTGSGSQAAPPVAGSGLSADGTFSSASYTFYASPTSGISIGNVGPGKLGPLTISGNGTPIALFAGSLVGGTSVLTAPVTGGYSATADINLNLTACTSAGEVLPSGVTCSANETAFFVDPLPADLQFVISNFSATTSVTTLTGTSPLLDLNIDGGGGNFTFVVPEPASLALLGTGLVALGALRRRSDKG